MSRRQVLENLLLAAGVALLVLLVRRVGASSVIDQVVRFKFWFLFICGLDAGWLFLQSVAWWLLMGKGRKRGLLPVLYRLKIVSDGLNTLLPTANLGGDAVRVYLACRYLPRRTAVSGILADKTIEFFAGLLFIEAGLAAALWSQRAPRTIVLAGLGLFGLLLAAMVFVVLCQRRGITELLLRITRVIPPLHRVVLSRERQLHVLDEQFRMLYTESPWSAVGAGVLHLGGRTLGALEGIVILRVLGVPVGALEVFMMTALLTCINTLFFFMPGQWGVAEGGHLWVVHSFGFPASAGLAMGVVKRIRRLLFVIVALVALRFENAVHEDHPLRRT